ncbi:hypothetical protein KC19_2G069600 [Ceratodon purpureus]|uniref:Dof-type domain-containing protein n=1 Tax=Ceratodon purpureus TaxID=3225 RepID=A0A8T0IT27_CERPU|nr:hypothetical protein KC19_2G069600 [Ceratodon purpureus]
MEAKVFCLHCRSNNVKFKYYNNGKEDQHRFKCLNCNVWFTWEDHNRPKPKHYKKVRNQDPVEFQGQRTQCNKCFVVNNARFKFYNNKKKYGETQPRFKCLSCCKSFQMHLKEGILVPVKSKIKLGKKAPEVIGPCIAPVAAGPCERDVRNVEQVHEEKAFKDIEDKIASNILKIAMSTLKTKLQANNPCCSKKTFS